MLRNVFTISWLKDSADRVLCTLLKSPSFGLRLAFREGGLEGKVLEVWNQLFEDLIKVGFPEILGAVHAKLQEPKRRLWCILARIWASVGVEEGGQNDWQAASEMLLVPVK